MGKKEEEGEGEKVLSLPTHFCQWCRNMNHMRLEQHSPQDPAKAPRFLVANGKTGHIFILLVRLSLLACILASVSLALYTVFFRPSRWLFPDHLHAAVQTSPPKPADPNAGPTNLSHILFAIAASENTWQDRSLFSKLWWAPNLTRGFVWLDKKPHYNESRTLPYRISDPRWTRFDYVHAPSAIRIARIVKESFRVGAPNVRWFVMGDDDTVFFPENLATVLGKYDHRQMMYIGANSESVEQNLYHGYGMAYGGGGFAISYSLADQLARIMDGCLRRYYYFYGSDQRVWACVHELGVSLTRELGFHQLDIRGDPYGILAAHPLAPLVSLHHLDMLDPVFPKMSQVQAMEKLMGAYRLDPSRLMQQCFCYDHKRHWSVSVSWGYTVQVYPTLWTAKDLQTPLNTFRTWGTFSDGPYTFNTRPMAQDPCDRPIIYFLDKLKAMANGSWSFSVYKRYVEAEGETKCDALDITPVNVQRVRVAALKLHPNYWNTQAPRRQCCQIMNGDNIQNDTLRIRIRSCGPQETIRV